MLLLLLLLLLEVVLVNEARHRRHVLLLLHVANYIHMHWPNPGTPTSCCNPPCCCFRHSLFSLTARLLAATNTTGHTRWRRPWDLSLLLLLLLLL